MNEDLIKQIGCAIEQFNRDKNVNANFLYSPAKENIIIGVYGPKETLEPLKQELTDYICKIDSKITLRGASFESQDYNDQQEIMYLFSI